MFVEATDFADLPYKVPNQEESKEFVAFIERWEEKLLKQVLGVSLYNEFIEGLEESGDITRWTNLQNGAEYTYGDYTYEYQGIVKMLVPAIYSEWVKIICRRFTTSGVIVNKGQQNTERVDPSYDIVTNWNEFVKQVGVNACQENSFYGFMIANEADYDGWNCTQPTIKNQLDF